MPQDCPPIQVRGKDEGLVYISIGTLYSVLNHELMLVQEKLRHAKKKTTNFSTDKEIQLSVAVCEIWLSLVS